MTTKGGSCPTFALPDRLAGAQPTFSIEGVSELAMELLAA
jgi:hypothetical protein